MAAKAENQWRSGANGGVSCMAKKSEGVT